MAKSPPDFNEALLNLKRKIINLKAKLITLLRKIFNDRKLITILVVIAVLVGLYYFISPYQNCMRDFADKPKTKGFVSSDTPLEEYKQQKHEEDKRQKRRAMFLCSGNTSW